MTPIIDINLVKLSRIKECKCCGKDIAVKDECIEISNIHIPPNNVIIYFHKECWYKMAAYVESIDITWRENIINDKELVEEKLCEE
jgi:hypothetical protein